MEGSYHLDDLIQALATPRGRGAIAVLRTSGPGCIDSFAPLFSRSVDICSSEGYRVHHGWIVDDKGSRIDEVLVTVFRSPASYTGQDSVEISCHGGLAVVDRISALLRSQGFRDAAPGEFTFRAFSAGKMDLTQAEAVKEIIDARTDRARALAVSRLAGAVWKIVHEAKTVVTRQSAVAALALDYPEDEVEQLNFDVPALKAARKSLNDLLGTWRTGRLYRDGLRVALVGPANAGKSSLFNLFLREERSIVTEIPGTTRDWVEAWLNLDGLPLRLVDTAGLRGKTNDPIEQEGIRRTRDLIAGSDLVIAVADGTEGIEAAVKLETEELEVLHQGLGDMNGKPRDRLIRTWNKSDLAPGAPEGWIPVSAVSGEGFSELENAIKARALPGGSTPEAGAPVIESMRQKALLQRAVEALDRFDACYADGSPADLLSEDLRDVLDVLGELTGKVSRTDVLEVMFGEFCVGK